MVAAEIAVLLLFGAAAWLAQNRAGGRRDRLTAATIVLSGAAAVAVTVAAVLSAT